METPVHLYCEDTGALDRKKKSACDINVSILLPLTNDRKKFSSALVLGCAYKTKDRLT